MAHIISSAVSFGRNSSAAENGDHQPGSSPPLSPAEDTDIELTAPKAAASPPPSPEIQRALAFHYRHTAATAAAAAGGSGAGAGADGDENKDTAHGSAGLDVSVGPSTSSAYQQLAHAQTLSFNGATGEGQVELGRSISLGRMSSFGTGTGGHFGPATPGGETDPLLLRSRLVSEQDVRRRPSGRGRKTEKKVNAFYENQNEHIQRLLKPMAKHTEEDAEDREASAFKIKVAVYGSIAANFILAGLQLYAAISSLSLSLFATAADSVFDPFANLVLNWLHRKSEKVDETKWPTGGSRFESIGNIVYAFLMGSVSLILIVESLRDIGSHSGNDTNTLYVPSLIAVGVAFCTKFGLFLYCYGLRNKSSQVQVLYEDHRNDLGINGFGIFTSAAGAKIAWWLDPLGAILISLVIIISWTRTAYLQFRELAGVSAPSDFLQLVIYNAMLHDADIQQIDSCRAYHSGPRYVVEVDIVMRPETPLWKSHDVSQDLQDKLEALPQVERVFVHVDHETDHRPEHRKVV